MTEKVYEICKTNFFYYLSIFQKSFPEELNNRNFELFEVNNLYETIKKGDFEILIIHYKKKSGLTSTLNLIKTYNLYFSNEQQDLILTDNITLNKIDLQRFCTYQEIIFPHIQPIKKEKSLNRLRNKTNIIFFEKIVAEQFRGRKFNTVFIDSLFDKAKLLQTVGKLQNTQQDKIIVELDDDNYSYYIKEINKLPLNIKLIKFK